METYSIRDLNFWYPNQTKKALDDISIDIRKGEFLTICGPSGCGKSTLLHQLKTVIKPHGFTEGVILFEGENIENISQIEQASKIGFVQQSPDNQIVTDKVWHELAFGLESLGYDNETIRARVAEMASFFGIQTWFYKNVTELSGGQKQLLNLASIMAMQPSVLILDEPTSQLDPIAASDFLATIGKINRELGTTIIITEHRLEEVLPMTDRCLLMDKGRVLACDSTKVVGRMMKETGHTMFLAMPSAMQIWASVEDDGDCPVTVREGRDWLLSYCEKNRFKVNAGKNLFNEKSKTGFASVDFDKEKDNLAVALNDVWFRYDRNLPDVVKGLNLYLRKQEFMAILGGNGTGKSTSLSLISGLRKAYRGDVVVNGKLASLPQNPQCLFVKKTVREDLFEVFDNRKISQDIQESRVARICDLCQLNELLDRHPYDLSGGEQQRAALAKVLLLDPEILLLDEPTKGLDAEFKQIFAVILKTLQKQGVSILMVSHDIEFCAEYADRCALFFDGNIVTENSPRGFFSGNSFYTTSTNRITRGILEGCVTPSDVIEICGCDGPVKPVIPETVEPLPKENDSIEILKNLQMPLWKKILAGLSFATAFYGFIKTLNITDLSKIVTAEGVKVQNVDFLSMSLIAIGLSIFAFAVNKKGKEPYYPVQMDASNRKLTQRSLVAATLVMVVMPATLLIDFFYFGNMKYYLFAYILIAESLLPYILVFKDRKPEIKEIVVIVIMCLIGILGRAAFFMVPNFKPVLAIVIITGVGLGSESGFMVAALTMFLSNIMYGQGPWTPYQMWAMGIIGLLAGILYKKGLLRRTKLSLCIFGVLSAIVIYGGLMNPVSALLWTKKINPSILLQYYITGLPVDIVHGVGTGLFIWFAAEPILEKLERLKEKYGLLQ